MTCPNNPTVIGPTNMEFVGLMTRRTYGTSDQWMDPLFMHPRTTFSFYQTILVIGYHPVDINKDVIKLFSPSEIVTLW